MGTRLWQFVGERGVCGVALFVSVFLCVCACDMLFVSIRNELIVVWELNLEERGVSKVSRMHGTW